MTTENNNIKLQEFITLGQRLYVLMHPYNPETVVGEIPKFIQSLEKCELKITLNTANPLNQIHEIRYYVNKRTGNDTAHPNPKQPNLEQANAYIKDLIDIITSQPFV